MRRYFLVSAAMSLGYGSIYTLLADLRDLYGFTESQLGVIVGAGFFAGFAAQVGLARLADRGYTAVMVRGGVTLAAVAMLGCALATDLPSFVLARAFLGLGSGMTGPAIRRLVILRAPGDVGANLGRMTAWDVAGFVLGPVVAAVTAEAIGLRAPFFFLAAVFLGVLALTSRLDLDAPAVATPDALGTRFLRNRALMATLAASIAFYTTIGVFEAVWAVLLRDHGAETWLIGLTLSMFSLPMVFLAPFGGRLAQRRGPLRTVTVSIAVATVCTLSYGVFDVLGILLAMSLVHATADAFTMPGNQVAVAMATPRHELAAGQGLLGATGLATAGAVGLAAGSIYEAAGAFTLFAGTAALMALCLGTAVVLGRSHPALAEPHLEPAAAAE